MTLYSDDGVWSVPAEAREVFDVSGAGDTVIAVLAAMLAAGVPLQEAVRLANRAGGIVVGKLGTATASYDELFGEERAWASFYLVRAAIAALAEEERQLLRSLLDMTRR